MIAAESQQLDFIRRFVATWRDRVSVLDPEVRARIGNLDRFDEPCQILAIWIQHPADNISAQLWIVTHFPDLPDLEIQVVGPLEPRESIARLPSLVALDILRRPLDGTFYLGATSIGDVAQASLVTLLEQFNNTLNRAVWLGERAEGALTRQIIDAKSFQWLVVGDPETLSLDTLVESTIPQPLSTSASEPQDLPTPPDLVAGFGTYVEPNVFVGTPPKTSFEDRLRTTALGVRPHTVDEIVYFRDVAGLTTAATNLGYVFVSGSSRESALRTINVMMALLTLADIPALSIRENELGEMTLDRETHGITQSSIALVLPRMAPAHPAFPSWMLDRTSVIQTSQLDAAWRALDIVLIDPYLTQLLTLFGEVFTHYQAREYPEVVLLAWIFVEQWAQGQREVTNDRLSGLGLIRHALGRSGLDIDEQRQILELRDLRAQVTHQFVSVSEDRAKSALSSVLVLLRSTRIFRPELSSA